MTLFSKIIAGEIPNFKIYENELVYAFLARDQVALGHTLIVPKIEVDYFVNVPEPYYSEIFLVAKKLASAVQNATDCKRVSTIIAGFDIPHFHYHLIPTNSSEDLNFAKAQVYSDDKMRGIQTKIVEQL
jgi:histidine triad (HIT) family protein